MFWYLALQVCIRVNLNNNKKGVPLLCFGIWLSVHQSAK